MAGFCQAHASMGNFKVPVTLSSFRHRLFCSGDQYMKSLPTELKWIMTGTFKEGSVMNGLFLVIEFLL